MKSWSSAIANISNRGKKALFLLKGYICSGNIKPGLGLKLFYQILRPILCYGSEIWSAFDGNKKILNNIDVIPKFLDSLDIENVHVKVCKFLMGVNKRVVNLAVKGELGRFPVGILCMLQALKYWYHIQSASNILLQGALAVSQNLHEKLIFTWFSFFSSLCKLVNVKPSDVTLETFVLLKEKLCDYFIRYWSERIKAFSKMDTYCLLKQSFGLDTTLVM